MHDGIQLEITESEVIVEVPGRTRVAFNKSEPIPGVVTGEDLQRMFDAFSMCERLITPRGANDVGIKIMAPPPFPNSSPPSDRIPSGTRRRSQ